MSKKPIQVKSPLRGFPGFRAAESIGKDKLSLALERLAPSIEGHYIYWTGNNYNFRRPSLRSNALRCLTEKRRPIALKTWIARAAGCAGDGMGYDPQTVKQGLALHQGAKPCVYFELKKDPQGNFRAVYNIPFADGHAKAIKAGDVVIKNPATNGTPKQLPSKGKPAVEARKTEAPQEQPSAPPAESENQA